MPSPIEYSCVFNHGIDLLYAYGTEVQIVYLESSERIIKQRNARHDTTLNNAGIDKMLCRWEVPVPTEVHEARYYPADFEVARGKIAQSS